MPHSAALEIQTAHSSAQHLLQADIELQPLAPHESSSHRTLQTRDDRRHEKLVKLLPANPPLDPMKFSHSIQFNAVPDWSSHYIAYSNLKKLIYTLEKEWNRRRQSQNDTDAEASPLLQSSTDDPDKIFTRALDNELEKIGSFYQVKELEIFGEVEFLLKDEEHFEMEHPDPDGTTRRVSISRKDSLVGGDRRKQRQNSVFTKLGIIGKRRTSMTSPSMDRIESEGESEDDNDGGEGALVESTNLQRTKTDDSSKSGKSSKKARRKSSSGGKAGYEGYDMSKRRASAAIDAFDEDDLDAAYDSGATLKKRMISLYVSVCELRSFIQLNKTGFTKVLKKYDKTLDRKLRPTYLEQKVEPAYTFRQSTSEHIDERITQIEQAYANSSTDGNLEQARRELRLDLREHVVWERNTVWRDMIGIERKAQAANLGVRRTMLGSENDPNKSRLQGDAESAGAFKEVDTPIGRYKCPRFLLTSTTYALLGSIIVFIVLLIIPILELPEQQNCLAMLVFISLLWATEAIPLFVTSLLVPLLVVLLQVVRTDEPPHFRLGSKAAASYIFAAMWTPVIMLLLGGFTIAAALSKYNIAKMMATFVLSKAGTKPRYVILTSMFVCAFLSMWISNVASPVLTFSIIQPILRNLPNDSNMIKALLLGIALAANIGGAASPISSPQNLIALENMDPEPGWGIWFFIALPVCIVSILLIWVLLLVTLKPGKGTTIVPIRPMKDKFTGTQYFIMVVTVVTIVLWCLTHQLEAIVGDMGVVAVVPLVLFFGTGILTKEDFNNFLWTIIILAAGGLALGKAVNSSGLLETIATAISNNVQHLSLYQIMVVFAALILVVATFISHTVAALIILPLVHEVGSGMPEPHPNLLVMSSVLMCSAAMGLPTSGFPNMTAIMMEDPQTGQRYLQVRHFITRGVPASILTFAVVVSLGYGLMRAAGL